MLVDFLLIWIGWPTVEEEGGAGEALLLRESKRSPPPPNETLVILHSLAICVEQLCARSPDAPSVESLRLKFCVFCGEPARDANGVLRMAGHGLYCRQASPVRSSADYLSVRETAYIIARQQCGPECRMFFRGALPQALAVKAPLRIASIVRRIPSE